MAGVKYMTGGPDLTAAVAGSNEFAPGQEGVLKVNMENRGLIDMKFVQSGIIERDDLPNTAKLVRVTLFPGDSPLIVKADPQLIGDIMGGKTVQVSFSIKVPNDAPTGDFTLPLEVRYTYLRIAEQYGQDAIQYTYKDINQTLSLPIRIRPQAHLQVVDIQAESLNAGTEGYLVLTLKNDGSLDARDAVVRIARNGNSPVIPTDSSIYLGQFPAGDTREARFKVSVSLDAGAGTYPLDLSLLYINHEGDTVTTDLITVGVPVGGKIAFAVVSDPAETRPGAKQVIEVEYQNTGLAPAREAQARISAVDPFTSNDDTAYLGDLAPGEKALARYEVSVDQGATAKEYGLDSEIRYRDALDNNVLSDTMKVRVRVVQGGLPLVAIAAIVLVIAAGAGAVYYFRIRRRKQG